MPGTDAWRQEMQIVHEWLGVGDQWSLMQDAIFQAKGRESQRISRDVDVNCDLLAQS